MVVHLLVQLFKVVFLHFDIFENIDAAISCAQCCSLFRDEGLLDIFLCLILWIDQAFLVTIILITVNMEKVPNKHQEISLATQYLLK